MKRFLELFSSGLIFIKAKIFMFIFGFFNIDNNKILVSNFDGKGYGESPAAVCNELLKHNGLKIYWVINDMNDKSVPSKITKVKFNSIKYFYHLRTSKVWIRNKRNNIEIDKRKEQFYIQTWHGPIGLKKIEKDSEEILNRFYIKAAKKDSKNIDLILSNSKHFTNIAKNSFWYSGRVEKYGTPKNDIIVNKKLHKDIINKVKKEYNIKDESIVLYAPTFRDGYKKDAYDIDLEKLQKTLNKLYNKDHVIFVRMHPNVANLDISNLLKNNKIINVSSYPETNELIIACDMLITDYSSVMFDCSLIKKKVFIYAVDADKYNRGFYLDLYKLPFSVSHNMEELLNNIKNFDNEKYLKSLNKFFEELEINEDGKASERVANEVLKVVGGKIGKK